jgi:hypothetical protein
MENPVIRFAIALAIFVMLWYVLLQVLLLTGGAEPVGLGAISVLAVTAGAVSYVRLGRDSKNGSAHS